MSIRIKMTIIVLLVALVPLAVSALTALRVHSRAYDQKTAELHTTSAGNLARIVDQVVAGQTERVRAVASPLPWVELTGQELAGALSLVYRQSDDIVSVQLVDSAGALRGSPVFARTRRDADRKSRQLVDPAVVHRVRKLAMSVRSTEPTAVAEAILAATSKFPILPVRITVPAANEAWTVVVGLSLRTACGEVRANAAEVTRVLIADARNRRLCHETAALATLDQALVDRLADSGGAGRFSYATTDGTSMVAAAAKLRLGGSVVVTQRERVATQPGRDLRNQTLLWIGASLIVALVAGLVLSGGITGPVRELTLGAEELARGNLDYRVPSSNERGDELAQLGGAFNKMTGEIQRQNQEIHEQNQEIQEWNETLQEKVELRTKELKEAQGQLLQSQKLAAMNALAAGVAHEINNPLAGVLGLIQVLRMRSDKNADEKTSRLLSRVEKDAQRIRDIVGALLSLRDEQEGAKQTVVVAEIVEATVGLVKGQLEERQLEIVLDVDKSLRIDGNSAQLRTALTHLLNNSMAASESGTSVEIRVSDIEGQLAMIEVRDEGRGIEPEHLARVFEPFYTTKTEWQGRGLGLAMVHRIVEEHHGRIEINSTVGVGTTVAIRLPLSAGGAHLT